MGDLTDQRSLSLKSVLYINELGDSVVPNSGWYIYTLICFVFYIYNSLNAAPQFAGS